jgi:hypothetical protein
LIFSGVNEADMPGLDCSCGVGILLDRETRWKPGERVKILERDHQGQLRRPCTLRPDHPDTGLVLAVAQAHRRNNDAVLHAIAARTDLVLGALEIGLKPELEALSAKDSYFRQMGGKAIVATSVKEARQFCERTTNLAWRASGVLLADPPRTQVLKNKEAMLARLVKKYPNMSMRAMARRVTKWSNKRKQGAERRLRARIGFMSKIAYSRDDHCARWQALRTIELVANRCTDKGITMANAHLDAMTARSKNVVLDKISANQLVGVTACLTKKKLARKV